MRNAILTVAAGLLISTAALADNAQPMTAQPVSATTSSDKLICHVIVHQGMLIRQNKQCKTQREWDQERLKEERDFATFQMRTYTVPVR